MGIQVFGGWGDPDVDVDHSTRRKSDPVSARQTHERRRECADSLGVDSHDSRACDGCNWLGPPVESRAKYGRTLGPWPPQPPSTPSRLCQRRAFAVGGPGLQPAFSRWHPCSAWWAVNAEYSDRFLQSTLPEIGSFILRRAPLRSDNTSFLLSPIRRRRRPAPNLFPATARPLTCQRTRQG